MYRHRPGATYQAATKTACLSFTFLITMWEHFNVETRHIVKSKIDGIIVLKGGINDYNYNHPFILCFTRLLLQLYNNGQDQLT